MSISNLYLSKNEYQSQLIYFIPGIGNDVYEIDKKITDYIQNKYGKAASIKQQLIYFQEISSI